ncbi:dolichyldiphosphatase [Entamoeba histolytica HM-3:IMSS]|uniref:Dolichyldiphosphatase n=1 Tax=Entamoeba histolytica HM-3:IMSS TaxID=885315 RepID=M7X290_ENTHI|nr:dolichyldiphosphatase [Entamoeba histolytica HM-3:IMSS]
MERKLRPVALAYVLFEEGDIIGHFMGYISILHLFVIGGIVSLILLTFDNYAIYTFGIMLTNEIINYTLKILFKHPRPHLSQNVNKGFPSSHAQFWCCFIVLFYYYINQQPKLTSISKKIIVYCSTLLILLVDFSRWYLNDHFVYQIVVGNVIGICVGYLGIIYYPTFFPLLSQFKLFIKQKLTNFNLITSNQKA